jgi:hypothetical protein
MSPESVEITRYLKARFPLLGRLFVQSLSNGSEQLPSFLGVLLAAMQSPLGSPLCFVLPKCGEIARLVAVLHGMTCFAQRFPQLAKGYLNNTFEQGDLVCVHPGGHVFKYGGFERVDQDYIWLEALDKNGGRRRVRATEFVTRLEKTSALRPMGRLNTPIHSPPPPPIDVLLGTTTFGNLCIMQNEVILLDSQSGVMQFAETVVLHLSELVPEVPPLKELLPLGQLVVPTPLQPSWLRKWDGHNPTGDPLVAVTHSAELLANFCIDTPVHSKLVVVNGLSRLRNLQAYDDMAQTQKLVLFTDQDDEEMIGVLGQRGCRFWWVTASEIKMDVNSPSNLSKGVIGKVLRWSRNNDKLIIEAVPCDNKALEHVYILLETLRGAVKADENGPLIKLVSRAWRMLNDACAVIRLLDAPENQRRIDQIAAFRREMEANAVWLSSELTAALSSIADGLDAVFAPDAALGISKAEALYRVVTETLNAGLRCALVARNENQLNTLDLWLQGYGFATRAQTCSPRTLPDSGDFDRLICVSWFSGDLMKQVTANLVAPRVTVLSYPFEKCWVSQFERRLKARLQVPLVTAEEKVAIVVREGEAISAWPESESAEPPPPSTLAADDDVWRFERRLRAARKGSAAEPTSASDAVPAHYISFVGEAFAFLTETHKVPVATDLVFKRLRRNQQLPERVVADLVQGDFIVFPESGDRELTQEVADKLLGDKAHKLRKLSHMWKDALWSCSSTPEDFLRHAKELGHPRHVQTIRHWFADTSQIGPQTVDDLALIQLVTKNAELENRAVEVWGAIEQLRGAHQSAGRRLRDVLLQLLPTVVGQVEENGIKVDLGELGSAWVVQVDTFTSTTELRGRGEVNRLLWEHPH